MMDVLHKTNTAHSERCCHFVALFILVLLVALLAFRVKLSDFINKVMGIFGKPLPLAN